VGQGIPPPLRDGFPVIRQIFADTLVLEHPIIGWKCLRVVLGPGRRAWATTKIEPVTQIRSSLPAQARASVKALSRLSCTLMGEPGLNART